jgi:hypothetical protein
MWGVREDAVEAGGGQASGQEQEKKLGRTSKDSLGADEIREEEDVVVDSLCRDDHPPEESVGLPHLHEGQQVHALVLGLIEQHSNPACKARHGMERMGIEREGVR